MTYTILQYSSGHTRSLSPANYCERLPTYYAARKAAKRVNFVYGIVRTDRVGSVIRNFEAKNN